MRLGTLVLGLLGILAYKNGDRIGAFLGHTTRAGPGQKGATELPDDAPTNDARRRRRTRKGMSGPVRQRELSQYNPVLKSTSGRDDEKGVEPGFMGSGDISQPVGAVPRSATTGRHDNGDANETLDGLNDTEELTRHLAEDTPTGGRDRDEEEIPVFERGRTRTRI